MERRWCEVCGRDVEPADAAEIAFSVDGLMCETPMLVHRACATLAADVLGRSGATACLATGYDQVSEEEITKAV